MVYTPAQGCIVTNTTHIKRKMDWTDFVTALGLMLIFEGIVPFLSPTYWKQILIGISEFSDSRLRLGSLVLMLVGLLVVYVARSWA